MTDNEYENIYQLQNDDNNWGIACELIKPVFNEYARWLTRKIINDIDEFERVKRVIYVDGYSYRLMDSPQINIYFNNSQIGIKLRVIKTYHGLDVNHTWVRWRTSGLSNKQKTCRTNFLYKLSNDLGNLMCIIEHAKPEKKYRRILSVVKSLLIYSCYEKFN